MGSSGLLCPLIPSFPPPQKRNMFLDPTQKNAKLKSEPRVLGKGYGEGRRILDEQRWAVLADGKCSGLCKASFCGSDLGGQAEGEEGSREGPPKRWLTCQPTVGGHWEKRSSLFDPRRQPSLGTSGHAGIFHGLAWTCHRGPRSGPPTHILPAPRGSSPPLRKSPFSSSLCLSSPFVSF